MKRTGRAGHACATTAPAAKASTKAKTQRSSLGNSFSPKNARKFRRGSEGKPLRAHSARARAARRNSIMLVELSPETLIWIKCHVRREPPQIRRHACRLELCTGGGP